MPAGTITLSIRPAIRRDRDDILGIYLAAFDASERALVAALADQLLALDTTPPTLCWVAERQGRIVGHVAFSPVTAADTGEALGYILAPLAVSPDHHGRGIGSALVEHGLAQLRAAGVPLLLVYGDPGYYGRFGFSSEVAAPFVPSYPLSHAFGWQGLALDHSTARDTTVRFTCVEPLRDPRLW